MGEKVKKIGFFGLIGMVISSCIGSGVFAITGQLAQVSSPGASLVAWGVVGVGFLALSLALANLGSRRPDLKGVFQYAEEGFGPLAGFISGWGYWISAWMGNVAFATMMMSTLGYFFPTFLPGNNIPCVIVASLFLWAMTFLIIRGVESASFLNAIVMVCKVLALGVFLVFGIVLFNAGVFTADFWGDVYNGLVEAGTNGFVGESLGGVGNQVMNCMIIMMWVFIGIEGAAVMSSRAANKKQVGSATVIGLVCLLVLYVGASILPYGFMSYNEVAALEYPALLYVFDAMAPGWGGAFISIAIILAIAGSWFSFTMLPAETTSEMAERNLLPTSWSKLNGKGAPQLSLILVGACVQILLIICMFSEDAYNFAFSMCTVAIVITWTFIGLFQIKYSAQQHDTLQLIIGVVAVVFQVAAVIFNGWSYLLLTCVGYIPGFLVYQRVCKTHDKKLSTGEIGAMGVISLLGVIALVLVMMGVITI